MSHAETYSAPKSQREYHKATPKRQKPVLEKVLAPRPTSPKIVYVSDEERTQVERAALELLRRFPGIHNPEFFLMLPKWAGELLPDRLYRKLAFFRSAFAYTDFGAIVLKGIVDVNQGQLGPTPERWKEVDRSRVKLYEFILALIHGAVGGAPIQNRYQRKGGGLVHSVIPDPDVKESQSGAGEVTLLLHTEDANLYNNADFISFLWLRNNEEVPCHLFSIRSLDLENKAYEKILWEPIFKCPLDGNYPSDNRCDNQVTVPVLYGNPIYPWFHADFAEQLRSNAMQSPRAQKALEYFQKDVLASTYSDFIPNNGDMCVLNNKMVAHGRGAFQQGVDPSGKSVEKRWMLRMMSVVDLFEFFTYAHPENPYFSEEMHFGKTEPSGEYAFRYVKCDLGSVRPHVNGENPDSPEGM